MNSDLATINNYFDSYLNNNIDIIKANKSLTKKQNIGSFGNSHTKGWEELPQEHTYFRYDGVRSKSFGLAFNTLRDVDRKVVIIGIANTTRIRQIVPFTKAPSENEDDIGYKIKMKDRDVVPSKSELKEMKEIEEFVLQCGNGYNPNRDDFYKFTKKSMRDTLIIDQQAISLGRNRRGDLIEYRILDGATIYPVLKDMGYKGDKKIKYVQIYDDKVVATFTENDLIFNFSNPRTDLRYTNFGYSYEEMAIDTITAFLYANQYNKDFFDKSTQPPGFISFDTGNVAFGEVDLKGIQRSWESMFKGVPGMWKTGFLAGKAKWNTIRPPNKDLEFNQYIQMLSSWIFALYGIDPAEVGLKLNQSQNVLNENPESKITYSQNRGLKEHLTFIEETINRILWTNINWQKYKFTFTGIEAKDQLSELTVDEKQTQVYMTVNEKRKEKDLDPIEHGDIILNPTYLQAMQNAQQAQEQEGTEEDYNEEENQNNEFNLEDFGNEEEEITEEIEKATQINFSNLMK